MELSADIYRVNFQQIVRSRTELSANCQKSNTTICSRDARPDRSTPDLSRPCELDAGFRVCHPRRCLLCARRFSAGSARSDAPAVLRPKQDARARCVRKTENDVNARYGNYQMCMTSCIEIIKYNSLTSSVGRKQHNVA